MSLSEVRTGVVALISTLLLLLACSSEEARTLAEEAFYAIEYDPFNRENLERAMADIDRAEDINPDEPWVAIARSRAALELGYRSGGRFRERNFHDRALDAAEYFATQGVELGPDESVAYSQLARVQIIHGEYREAWNTLNKAHGKDPDNFYPWYFRSVIAVQMKDRERAEKAISEAEKRVVRPLHQRFVLGQRSSIALAMGSEKEKEDSYLAIIEHSPDSAYSYGNYGAFLLRRERYEEAEAMLEKALSIGRYRAAEEDLAKARRRGE